LIPEDFVQEQEDRLHFYRLLAGAVSSSEIDGVAEEICDRFGPLPEPVFNLLLTKKIRLFSVDSAFKSVEVDRGGATLWLGAQKDHAVVSLVRSSSTVLEENNYSFSVINKRGGQVGIRVETGSLSSALQAVEYLFESPGVSL
jgi:transcription-repair coupling factor (superfamily II helicase)